MASPRGFALLEFHDFKLKRLSCAGPCRACPCHPKSFWRKGRFPSSWSRFAMTRMREESLPRHCRFLAA